MDIIKVLAVIVLVVGINLAWVAGVVWIGANIIKGVFGG